MKKFLCFIVLVSLVVSLCFGTGCTKDNSNKEENVLSGDETNNNEENNENQDNVNSDDQKNDKTNKNNENTSEKNTDPFEAYRPKDEKDYKITWTAWQKKPLGDDPYIIEYFEEMCDVDIEVIELPSSNPTEVLSLNMASGNIPDLIWNQGYTARNTFVRQGLLMPFEESVVEEFAPNLYKQYTDFDENFFKENGVVDNNLYSIHSIKTNSVAGRHVVAYRGDWLEKLGYDKGWTPTTLDEFEEVLYKFANEDPDGNNKKDTYGISNSGMWAVFGAFGFIPRIDTTYYKALDSKCNVAWYERDGKIVYGSIQPEVKEALRVLQKWYEDGVLDPAFFNDEKVGSDKIRPFVDERVGVTCGCKYYDVAPRFRGENTKGGDIYEEILPVKPEMANSIIMGLPPEGPEGKAGLGSPSIIQEQSYSFSINLEKEPDKFGKMLEVIDTIVFSSLDNANTAWYGLKGQDWDYDENGVAVRLEDAICTNGAKSSSHGGHTVMRILIPTNWGEDEALKNYIHEVKCDLPEYCYTEVLNGELPSANIYMTELQKIQDEAFIQIINGSESIDYFDTFVDNWRNAGGSILEKEANEMMK